MGYVVQGFPESAVALEQLACVAAGLAHVFHFNHVAQIIHDLAICKVVAPDTLDWPGQ